MILNRTDNPINREGRNKLNENWETLERTYKKVVDDSSEAKTTAFEAKEIAQGIDGKATEAVDTANQANTKSDNAVTIATQKGNDAIDIANQANNTSNYVQQQLDTVILESGDANPEVIQARADFVNLRDRLDTEFGQVTTQLANTIFSVEWDSSAEDFTTKIQSAMNNASENSGIVKLEKGRTYIVGSLVPKQNVIIDLNGSTLKLKNNTNLPLFYDYSETTTRSNFGIVNGTLDCNMDNNSDAINQSAGTLWISNFDNLYFRNITVINAFRNVFNFFGVQNVVAENIYVKNCGKSNTNGFYSYGFSVESSPQRSSANVSLTNFTCENMYGFGVHMRKTKGFVLKNLNFIDIYCGNYAIAITLTDSSLGVMDNISIKKNVKTYSVDSHAIEINNSFNITMNNVEVDSVRTTSIIIGDNNTGVVGQLIKMTNIKTSNSGQYSMNINYIDGLIIENSQFDKQFTTLYANPTKNVQFNNCKFLVNCNDLMSYNRFNYKNTSFSDLYIAEKLNASNKVIYTFPLSASETKTINLSVVKGEGVFIGDVDIVSKWNNGFNQGGYAKYMLYATNIVHNSLLTTKIAGSFERLPVITFEDNVMSLANNSTESLSINVVFNNKNISGLSLT